MSELASWFLIVGGILGAIAAALQLAADLGAL